MKARRSGRLWRVSVLTSLEAEEAVTELLSEVLHEPAVSYADLERLRATVSVYLPKRPDHFPATRSRLRAGLARIQSCGLRVAPGRIRLAEVPRADWAKSWKRHFRPFSVGPSLLIKPSWSRRQPRHGQAMVVIDPGLSFGTGQHPTTAFCLAQLVAWRRPAEAQSFLDTGTGSGILAIAAARLGYAPVRAFDYDPDAVRIARANARLNQVSHRIRFDHHDLARLPLRPREPFSMVCANLTSDLLLRELPRILSRLKSEGRLVLAGVLTAEFAEVQQAYAAAGWGLVGSAIGQEWRSGAFERQRR